MISDDCCQVFHALADKTRLQILKLLVKQELCVSDIWKKFDVSQPAISHHLDILKRAGLVSSDKRGREVYYSFIEDRIICCCGNELSALSIVVGRK